MFEAEYKLTPEQQIPREEVLKLVESQEEILFIVKQDYADEGVVVSANLNEHYKESYGTVRMKGSDGKIFCTDIANIEFALEGTDGI